MSIDSISHAKQLANKAGSPLPQISQLVEKSNLAMDKLTVQFNDYQRTSLGILRNDNDQHNNPQIYAIERKSLQKIKSDVDQVIRLAYNSKPSYNKVSRAMPQIYKKNAKRDLSSSDYSSSESDEDSYRDRKDKRKQHRRHRSKKPSKPRKQEDLPPEFFQSQLPAGKAPLNISPHNQPSSIPNFLYISQTNQVQQVNSNLSLPSSRVPNFNGDFKSNLQKSQQAEQLKMDIISIKKDQHVSATINNKSNEHQHLALTSSSNRHLKIFPHRQMHPSTTHHVRAFSAIATPLETLEDDELARLAIVLSGVKMEKKESSFDIRRDFEILQPLDQQAKVNDGRNFSQVSIEEILLRPLNEVEISDVVFCTNCEEYVKSIKVDVHSEICEGHGLSLLSDCNEKLEKVLFFLRVRLSHLNSDDFVSQELVDTGLQAYNQGIEVVTENQNVAVIQSLSSKIDLLSANLHQQEYQGVQPSFHHLIISDFLDKIKLFAKRKVEWMTDSTERKPGNVSHNDIFIAKSKADLESASEREPANESNQNQLREESKVAYLAATERNPVRVSNNNQFYEESKVELLQATQQKPVNESQKEARLKEVKSVQVVHKSNTNIAKRQQSKETLLMAETAKWKVYESEQEYLMEQASPPQQIEVIAAKLGQQMKTPINKFYNMGEDIMEFSSASSDETVEEFQQQGLGKGSENGKDYKRNKRQPFSQKFPKLTPVQIAGMPAARQTTTKDSSHFVPQHDSIAAKKQRFLHLVDEIKENKVTNTAKFLISELWQEALVNDIAEQRWKSFIKERLA